MSKTILCADDSVTMQKVAEITFAATEYRYIGARTVDEALALAHSEQPDLVLADAVMAGKNGYDLCRAIKAEPPLAGIPVLIMCGNSQLYDGARGASAGADGQVTKPWDTQVMLDKVAETLARVESEGAARLGEGAAAPAPPAAAVRPPRAPSAPLAPSVESSRPPLAPVPPVRAPSAVPGNTTRAASQPHVVSAGMPQAPRTATIMGMPTVPLPPASEAIAAVAAAAPQGPPPVPAAASHARANSSNDRAAPHRPPMIKGTPNRRLRLVPISEVAAQVASEHGLSLDGPEMQALVKLSREVVERIVWEVVPDLAEVIIRQNLDKLTARAR